ncbi:cytochrome c1 [Aeromonas hydrophila]|uniref:Cytochrome c1 n=1 Tax=Aeromonas hydrophila TaxID=644 RepID=A0A926IYX9_AERHY|nr:cytochrome c1 [Aeromonas hydrophila]
MAPPDLTLVARVRGADWIYTYLRSFYVDETRPFGVNNVVFRPWACPMYWSRCKARPAPSSRPTPSTGGSTAGCQCQIDGNGEMNNEEYDQTVLDLVNFLVYSAEPVQQERERMGFWVLGFIVIFFIFTVLLKKEFWRDVH